MSSRAATASHPKHGSRRSKHIHKIQIVLTTMPLSPHLSGNDTRCSNVTIYHSRNGFRYRHPQTGPPSGRTKTGHENILPKNEDLITNTIKPYRTIGEALWSKGFILMAKEKRKG